MLEWDVCKENLGKIYLDMEEVIIDFIVKICYILLNRLIKQCI